MRLALFAHTLIFATATAHLRTIQVPESMVGSCLLATGADHSCAIRRPEGELVCWGANSYGQLGIDSRVARVDLSSNTSRTLLPGPASCVCAGWSFTCALLVNGSLTCWGWNLYGQTGHGDTDVTGYFPGSMGSVPLVDLGMGSPRAVAVVCGAEFACALTEAGGVRCWGVGSAGELGIGTNESIGDEPGEMSALEDIAMPGGAAVVHLSAGMSHICAVLNTSTALCWGLGDDGQLGQNTQFNIGDFFPPDPLAQLPPINVGGTTKPIASAACGAGHSCLVDGSRQLYCFGSNPYGELGQDCTLPFGSSTFYPTSRMHAVVLPDGAVVERVVGGSGTTCVLSAAGAVYCFGWGPYLGRDNATDVGNATGSMAALQPLSLGGRPVTIAAGGTAFHACALYEEPERAVQCWGLGSSGQLGRGNLTDVGCGPRGCGQPTSKGNDFLESTRPVPF